MKITSLYILIFKNRCIHFLFMKKFILNLFFFFLPFLIIIFTFIILDPFRIIYKYDDYSKDMHVISNRDFVSSEMFIKHNEKQQYNSFIFGASVTLAFRTNSWKKHLPSTASPYVFDATGETTYGIFTKVKYLDKIGTIINNCIIVICPGNTFTTDKDQNSHLQVKHPAIAGTSWANFYFTFVKDYLNPWFLKNYFQFLITHKYVSSMSGYIENRRIIYDTISNDITIVDQEEEIANHPKEYYVKRKNIFFSRDVSPAPWPRQLSARQIEMYKFIKTVFDKNKTNYKVIIAPMYDQRKMDSNDLKTVKQIFGNEYVFDFAGKNIFTEKKENYYEHQHFRPMVGDSILKLIYTKGSEISDVK